MKKLIYGITFLATLFAGGCGEQNSNLPIENESDHAPHEEVNEDEVHLVQKQMDVMDIELGKFQFLNLSTTVKSNGRLELPPQNKASVSAIMSGRVKSINVQEGDYVKNGQTLATLEHPSFVEIQEQYMNAKSQLNFLEKNYQRKKELHTDSITSTKVYEQAEADYLSALANMNGLKAKLQMLDINLANLEEGNFISAIAVRAPINGYVRDIAVNMGKFVQPEFEMFEIVDNDHIHIDLTVYEKDMNKIVNGQKVHFSLSNNPDSIFQGSIFAVGKSFEQVPKAMIVHAEIDNKKGNLLPGMYVDARIITHDDKVRALPDDAIVSDGGLNYIFVLKPASTQSHEHADGEVHEEENHEDEFLFRKIEVNTGASDIGFTEVVPAYNLPEHVQIVTKGAFYLLAEMKKGEGGHGHHH